MTSEKRAVVKVTVTGSAPNDRRKPAEAGSGFVIHSSARNSLIITAAHVIGSSEWREQLNPDWLVEPDGRTLKRRIRIGLMDTYGALTELAQDAAVIHQDDQKDIAVLLVDGFNLPTIGFAANASEIEGDVQKVRVMGFPKDRQALDIREGTGQLQYLPQSGLILRIGVHLPKGMSGGPVIDLSSGKVIAIASVNVGASQDHHAAALFPVLSAIAPYIEYARKVQATALPEPAHDRPVPGNILNVHGDGNTVIQGGSGSTIIVGESRALAERLTEEARRCGRLEEILAQKDGQLERMQAQKDGQIAALECTIEELRQGAERGTPGMEEALAMLSEGKSEAAEALFARIAAAKAAEGITANKEAAQAFRNIGNIAFLHNTQKALDAYAKATELDPDDPAGWNQLGHLQRRIGNLKAAQRSFERVLALGNQRHDQEWIAMATGNLGLVFYQRGDLDRAEEMHEKSLAIDEDLDRKQGGRNILQSRSDLFRTRRSGRCRGNA
jgi:Flp pilus assembly protein TadD